MECGERAPQGAGEAAQSTGDDTGNRLLRKSISAPGTASPVGWARPVRALNYSWSDAISFV